MCESRENFENLTHSFAYLAPPVRPLGGKVMYVTIHNPLAYPRDAANQKW